MILRSQQNDCSLFSFCSIQCFKMRYLVSVFSLLAVMNLSTEEPFRIVCYYTNWSQYRYGKAMFVPDNINPSLCTHFVYAFAGLNIVAETTKVELKASEWNDESTGGLMGMYEQFQKIRNPCSNVKTLLAVDGWSQITNNKHNMFTSRTMIRTFAEDAVTFLRKYKFDGLDMHWNYNDESLPPNTKDLLGEILMTLLTTFVREATREKRPRLLLVVSTNAPLSVYKRLYNRIRVWSYIDFMNLITYDLHGPWNNFTHHFSPLFDKNDSDANSVESLMQSWVSASCPREKLNLGLAFYGRSFTLTSNETGLNAPAFPGRRGLYTRTDGFLAHYEICKMKSKSTREMYLKDNKVFYMISGNQWVAYENDISIRTKVCYAKHQGFGGVMIWAVDLDDFNGEFCGKGKWPLLKAVKDQIEGKPPCEPVAKPRKKDKRGTERPEF